MYHVPFDRGTLTFDLPPGWRGAVAESRMATPVVNVTGAVRSALAHPTNSAPLREMARPGSVFSTTTT